MQSLRHHIVGRNQRSNEAAVVGILHFARNGDELFLQKRPDFLALHPFFEVIQATVDEQESGFVAKHHAPGVAEMQFFAIIAHRGKVVRVLLVAHEVKTHLGRGGHPGDGLPGGVAVACHNEDLFPGQLGQDFGFEHFQIARNGPL